MKGVNRKKKLKKLKKLEKLEKAINTKYSILLTLSFCIVVSSLLASVMDLSPFSKD